MRRFGVLVRVQWAAVALLVGWPSAARACPVCRTESGARVRAGIFDSDFGRNVLVTLTPAAVLLGIVALIHVGPGEGPAAGRPGR